MSDRFARARALGICLAMSSALLAGWGCETLDKMRKMKTDMDSGEEFKPKCTVSVNRLVAYPRGERNEKEVVCFDGRIQKIDDRPFITSRNVKKIERRRRAMDDTPAVNPEDYEGGMYDLVVHLDRQGAITWSQMAVGYHKEDLAMLIDDRLYRVFRPLPLEDETTETAVIAGPFDDYTAGMLVKYAEDNYGYYIAGEKEEGDK